MVVFVQVVVELSQLERKLYKLPLQELEYKASRHGLQNSGQWDSERILGVAEVQYPYVVWWSPLTGETGRLGECGTNKCFFTINKTYYTHPSTHAFLFYGEEL